MKNIHDLPFEERLKFGDKVEDMFDNYIANFDNLTSLPYGLAAIKGVIRGRQYIPAKLRSMPDRLVLNHTTGSCSLIHIKGTQKIKFRDMKIYDWIEKTYGNTYFAIIKRNSEEICITPYKKIRGLWDRQPKEHFPSDGIAYRYLPFHELNWNSMKNDNNNLNMETK